MLDKVRNVQFHSWNISSSQNHSMRLLRSWFNHLSKLIFGVGLYSSPFIIVLEDCELNSKVRIELLLPGNVTLCKRQYKSQAAADYLYEDLWIEINFSCSDAEVSNRRERKISIFNWQHKKYDHFLHFQSLFLQFRFYRLDHLHHHFQTQKNWVSFKS